MLREAPDSFQGDGTRLAARAYLSASYMTDSLWGRMEYRGLAKALLSPPGKKTLRKFEKRYGKEMAKGRKLFKRIKGDEKRWTRGPGDVDRKFEERYLLPDIIKIFGDTALGKFLVNVRAGKDFGNLKKLKL